ncbi:benzoate transporter [Paracoccus subflavus]|uniref:Benzoate transporter n=1 Tax=Paracoccus subflavus TaxID=2528244 RepID=A0A4Q9G187_9RHOB|nr:aromatic-ring-hydroxylating dioxygenase subunit beta [Paracoccus subflavus]TBN36364.1 benzoate transporter [Paracoccus subflavus]
MNKHATIARQSEVGQEYEAFLFHEARLMDNHRLEEWLALWDRDCLYWVPCNAEEVDPNRQLSIIYDGYDQIRERVRRLSGKFAHAQQPKSRLIRVLSNIEIESADDGTITGHSTFVLGEVRLNRQVTWFGRNEHTLVRTEEGLRIRRKKVFVLNNDTPMPNMTFLI